ncbi:hypothetical protein VMT65_22355 [Nocardia sp. CDC153]|uniref:helix-turn-helix domain-containing protein n=1 Tax=Nocardia sp. CDC153 TaxID=3112167 RepID=UPI002DBA0680|nr:hypothetical protein [Nocardia sp. CDC153]MEC3955792.1 hypothetical protein [Nocardia sp. CDC153]
MSCEGAAGGGVGEGVEGGLVDWMDRCVGNRVGRAIAKAGVNEMELMGRLGLSDSVLALRLAAPGSFRVDELILVAAALDRGIQDLLPDAACLPGGGCAVCSSEK